MQSPTGIVVVIATGGTIAGTAADARRHTGYTAGEIGAEALVAAVPALQAQAIEAITLARLDSCDMDFGTWAQLHQALSHQLARPEVAGVVVTHGTDTLEETAYFLHRTLAAPRPVVLTAAMRPATAASPDGPQNLVDAVTVARAAGARGVVAVLSGQVLRGADLRKVHGYRVEAFSTGDAGPLGVIEDGRLRRFRDWPQDEREPAPVPAGTTWPWVEIVTSHAGARGTAVELMVAAGVRGLVIAGTGNGSVHRELLAAARRAQDAGVRVLRASRCLLGGVVGESADALPSAGTLTPAQARVELMLALQQP